MIGGEGDDGVVELRLSCPTPGTGPEQHGPSSCRRSGAPRPKLTGTCPTPIQMRVTVTAPGCLPPLTGGDAGGARPRSPREVAVGDSMPTSHRWSRPVTCAVRRLLSRSCLTQACVAPWAFCSRNVVSFVM